MNSHTRLPAPMGLLIDRERPLHFEFDGQACPGFAGDTLPVPCSAMAAGYCRVRSSTTAPVAR